MKILFDQGTPAPLRQAFAGEQVATAHEIGWGTLSNGELLREAEAAFELLVTTDQNLRYEQNLGQVPELAILVLPTTSWPRIRQQVEAVVAAARAMGPGELRQIVFPP